MDIDEETKFSGEEGPSSERRLSASASSARRDNFRRAVSPGRLSSDAASDVEGGDNRSVPAVIIIEDGTERNRTPVNIRARRDALLKSSTEGEIDFEKSAVHIAENSIEAARISNNYKVGPTWFLFYLGLRTF